MKTVKFKNSFLANNENAHYFQPYKGENTKIGNMPEGLAVGKNWSWTVDKEVNGNYILSDKMNSQVRISVPKGSVYEV